MPAVVKAGLWVDCLVAQTAARLAVMSDSLAARTADRMVGSWAATKGCRTAEQMVVLKAAYLAGPMVMSLVESKVVQKEHV